MSTLSTFADFAAQDEYQREVPSINVPTELLCTWDDLAGDHDWSHLTEPVFTPPERAAVVAFDRVQVGVVAELPHPMPSLLHAQRLPGWSALSEAARTAMTAFT